MEHVVRATFHIDGHGNESRYYLVSFESRRRHVKARWAQSQRKALRMTRGHARLAAMETGGRVVRLRRRSPSAREGT